MTPSSRTSGRRTATSNPTAAGNVGKNRQDA